VRPETLHVGTANGFAFEPYSTEALVATVGRAIAAYRDAGLWRWLQYVGMRADFSWDRAAEKYVTLYTITIDRASKSQ
jgi:starch synthase